MAKQHKIHSINLHTKKKKKKKLKRNTGEKKKAQLIVSQNTLFLKYTYYMIYKKSNFFLLK